MNGAIADVPRTRSYQSPFDVSDQDVYRVRLDVEHQSLRPSRLQGQGVLHRPEVGLEGTLIVGAFPIPGFTTIVARTLPMLDDRQKWLGNQAELTSRLRDRPRAPHAAGGRRGQPAGATSSRRHRAPAHDRPLPPGRDRAAAALHDPGQSQAGDARTLVIAPYLMDRIDMGRFQVLAGARLDSLDYDEAIVPTTRDATKVSPLLGLVFEPTHGLSLYASGGSAFGPPSSLVVGERDPEESRQVEAGIKKSFLGGKAFATAAVYHLEKDNIAIPDATGVTRQTGDQRANGFETELQVEAQPGWFASASYAFTDAELTRFSGARVPAAAALLPGARPLGQPAGLRAAPPVQRLAGEVAPRRLPGRRGRALRGRAVHLGGQLLPPSPITSCSTRWRRTGAAASGLGALQEHHGPGVRDARVRRRVGHPREPLRGLRTGSRSGWARTDGQGHGEDRRRRSARAAGRGGRARWSRGTSIPATGHALLAGPREARWASTRAAT